MKKDHIGLFVLGIVPGGTFGSGEQERVIVAGIHGGDEWSTILDQLSQCCPGIFPRGLFCDKNSIWLAEAIAQVTSYPFPPIAQDVRIQVHLQIMRCRPGLPL